MNVNDLVSYAKQKPYIVGGAAAVGIGVVGWVWWQRRGAESSAPSVANGLVNLESKIPDGYPGVIVNQPAPVLPNPNVPGPSDPTLPPTIPKSTKLYADTPVDKSKFPQYSCPIGSTMVYEKRKGTVNQTTGNIVCRRADGVTFPVTTKRQ